MNQASFQTAPLRVETFIIPQRSLLSTLFHTKAGQSTRPIGLYSVPTIRVLEAADGEDHYHGMPDLPDAIRQETLPSSIRQRSRPKDSVLLHGLQERGEPIEHNGPDHLQSLRHQIRETKIGRRSIREWARVLLFIMCHDSQQPVPGETRADLQCLPRTLCPYQTHHVLPRLHIEGSTPFTRRSHPSAEQRDRNRPEIIDGRQDRPLRIPPDPLSDG